MLTRNVAVVRNHITSEPIAIYDGRKFIRIDEVLNDTVIHGKGHRYTCLYKGEEIILWQRYEIDNWFVEVDTESAG